MPSLRKNNRTRPRPTTAFILAVLSVTLFAAGFVFIGFYVESVNGPHLRYLGTTFLTACAVFVVGCMVGLIVGIPRFVSSGALRHDVEARRVRAAAAGVAAASGGAGSSSGSGFGSGSGSGDTGGGSSGDPGDGSGSGSGSGDSTADQTIQAAQVPSSQLTPSTNLAEISDWLTKLLLGAGLVELTRLGHPLSTLVNTVARAMQDIPAGAKPPQSSLVVAAGLLTLYLVLGFLDGYVITTLWYGNYLERLDSN